jgi:hypothetical protein
MDTKNMPFGVRIGVRFEPIDSHFFSLFHKPARWYIEQGR